jgi:hypothetical protein
MYRSLVVGENRDLFDSVLSEGWDCLYRKTLWLGSVVVVKMVVEAVKEEMEERHSDNLASEFHPLTNTPQY